MSKFNTTSVGVNKTTNKSGNVAYKMKDKELLVSQVCTSLFGEAKFYGDNTNELKNQAKKMVVADGRFVANLAMYSRKELHLRSVSHFLTALLANTNATKPLVKEVVNVVVERADDITEILSCYISMFGKPIPNSLKKALGNVLNRFDEYALSKYAGGNKSLKLRDVLKLIHAKPKNEAQSLLFKKVIEDTLAVAVRWETAVSANGNNAETWEKLIADDKIGYMAGIKNMRNVINANPTNIKLFYDRLENKDAILRSKLLPFRFYSAFKELQKVSGITNKPLNVLENAIEHSLGNLPLITGKTVIAIDVSGSMSDFISNSSTIRCSEIASLLGAMSNKLCEETIIYTFDTNIRKYTITQRNGILETAKQLNFSGGGTDINLVIKTMLNDKIVADRVIIFSDNESNSGFSVNSTGQRYAEEYRKTINPNLWVHAVDLAGYGTQQFVGGKTNLISGWNEKVLEFISLSEQGFETQVKRIENYHTTITTSKKEVVEEELDNTDTELL